MRLPPKSPGRLWLVGFQQRRGTSRGKLRPPLGVGKDHLPIAYFAASRLDRELADSLKNNGRAFLVAVGEHFPRLRDLRHEDQAFNDLASGLGEGLDQEDPPFRVDFHLAVAQTGNFHGDGTASQRLNYELEPADSVTNMDFAVDQAPVHLEPVKPMAAITPVPISPSITELLLTGKPIRLLPSKQRASKPVEVWISDLYEK